MIANDRPVFIVGCARSGTTLLQLMIHSHPRLAMPPENRFLMPIYEQRVEFGNPSTPAAREAVADTIMGRGTKFGDLDLEADAVRDRIHEVPPSIGSFIGCVLELHAAQNGRARWGDKRPNYIQFLDRILALFPDAQILHIIRDGRDCVASLKRMPWWTYGIPASIYKWKTAMQIADEAKRTLRPDQYHELHYEELVRDPQPVLEKVCTFLDEEFDPSMLEPHTVADEQVPDYKSWHERAAEPVSTAPVRRFETELDLWELQLMEHVAQDELVSYGYEPVLSGSRKRPRRAQIQQYEEFLDRRSAKEARREAAEAARREVYPWPVAARLTIRQRCLAEAADA